MLAPAPCAVPPCAPCAACAPAPPLPPLPLDPPFAPPPLGANCPALAELPRGCLDSSHPSSPVGVAERALSAEMSAEKSATAFECSLRIVPRKSLPWGLDTPLRFLVYYAPKALRKDPRGEKDGARRDKPCAEHERKRSDEREERKQWKRRTRRSVRAVREQEGRRMADGGGGRVRRAVVFRADPRGGLL